MRTALVSRFGLADDEQTRFLFECAIEVSDSMASRAFLFDPQGEEKYLEASRDIVYRMLSDHFSK
jgi:hypothetical protein